MSEFSRRVNVELIRDEPLSPEQFAEQIGVTPGELTDARYQLYLDHFQPYRWRAKAMNGEIIARGESYFNEADAINAVELLCGDDTTVYWAPMFGEDRGYRWLRYGATDRSHQAGNV